MIGNMAPAPAEEGPSRWKRHLARPEYVAPASAVTDTAPTPVIEYVAPAPTVTYAPPAPVTEYVAPARADTNATHPAIECTPRL